MKGDRVEFYQNDDIRFHLAEDAADFYFNPFNGIRKLRQDLKEAITLLAEWNLLMQAGGMPEELAKQEEHLLDQTETFLRGRKK